MRIHQVSHFFFIQIYLPLGMYLKHRCCLPFFICDDDKIYDDTKYFDGED